MNPYDDLLRLNEHVLFEDLKGSLPKNIKDTRNILQIRDNVLYVWNPNDFCVMTLNIAAVRVQGDKLPYQKLRPVDAPIFEVKHLLVNDIGTQVALWGNLGLIIMELPAHWRDGMFQGGKDEILCKIFNETVEIRKARWHPGSTNGSHLLVLTSENTFRLYECEVNSKPKMIKSWRVGRIPLSSPSKMPDFASLGDTAVDFDFATPTVLKPKSRVRRYEQSNTEHGWDQIEWPILVLRGNGEVLIVHGNVLKDSAENPVVSGSLSMYPPTDDNYGTDSCSIMCIQTTPPIVVIAMCTGKIYHAILLKEMNTQEKIDTKSWSEYDSSYTLHVAEEALYVYEYVEIELGLFYADTDEKYHCPIHLRGDDGNKSRYFCSHNAGVHMISLPMVPQLEEYINAAQEIEDACLPSLSNQSSSQYLICRRTKHTQTNEATPILGFGLVQEPCVLIVLLHTGDVVTRAIFDLFYFPNIKLPENVIDKKEKNNREDFDIYIKKLLQHESSQPIIKIGALFISPRECLQLLYHATDTFRKEHFVKHDAVREEIGKKTRALKIIKNHLLKELDTLMESKKKLQSTAEYLAERYEDINDKQKELALRAKDLLWLVNFKKPSMTPIERAEADQLRKMEIKIEEMKVNLLELTKKSEQQTRHVKFSANKKDIQLNSKQENTIKDNLRHMAKDIEVLMQDIKKLAKDVSI